jgi:predicted  nucleic acid-binding Zn-ribbon protein
MGITDDMKRITEDIIASHDMRVKALSNIVGDTRKILGDARKTVRAFGQDRKEMASEQAENLSCYVKDLSKDVGNKLKDFRALLKQISSDRVKMSGELKSKLAKDVKGLVTYVKNRLKEFDQAHARMSDAMRKDLAKTIKDISSSVEDILGSARKLLGEYASDMQKARDVWQNMASALARSRKSGVMPRIEAGERIATVEKTAQAKRKYKKRKKRRSKKK